MRAEISALRADNRLVLDHQPATGAQRFERAFAAGAVGGDAGPNLDLGRSEALDGDAAGLLQELLQVAVGGEVTDRSVSGASVRANHRARAKDSALVTTGWSVTEFIGPWFLPMEWSWRRGSLVPRLATMALRRRNPHHPHLDPERHHRTDLHDYTTQNVRSGPRRADL
ncbi:hypothetical protein ACIBEK_08110 [Nocardia fusca]|uniref:hypothetical protein n=1 Tax=Nocardia fusca TaxID=941183 RepID=UPI0037BA5A39